MVRHTTQQRFAAIFAEQVEQVRPLIGAHLFEQLEHLGIGQLSHDFELALFGQVAQHVGRTLGGEYRQHGKGCRQRVVLLDQLFQHLANIRRANFREPLC